MSVIPVAVAGAIAVRVAVFYINRYTLSHVIPFFLMDYLGADSLVGGGSVVMLSDCALGASFVYIAALVAPTRKMQVTIAVGAFAFLLGLSRSLYLLWLEDYWGAFTYSCASVGAVACSAYLIQSYRQDALRQSTVA